MVSSGHVGRQFEGHPVYEVGDPDNSRPERGYIVSDYSAKDKVHPGVFGMKIRPWAPGRGGQLVRVGRQDVPLDKVYGNQDYVYAPHVRNLASVPGHVMEPVSLQKHEDGTYTTDDHHRVAAAHLRGDRSITADVWERR